jgi:hypothetical protein
MGAGAVVTSGGDGGYHHLIDPSRTWTNNKRLIALNAWIVLLLITSSTNGFDGSMMNGLQSLTQWKDAFNNPTGGKLGLLNAIQVNHPIAFVHFSVLMSRRTSAPLLHTPLRRIFPMALAVVVLFGLGQRSCAWVLRSRQPRRMSACLLVPVSSSASASLLRPTLRPCLSPRLPIHHTAPPSPRSTTPSGTLVISCMLY